MFYLDMVEAETGAPINVSASITLANTTFPNEVVEGSADPLQWCVRPAGDCGWRTLSVVPSRAIARGEGRLRQRG